MLAAPDALRPCALGVVQALCADAAGRADRFGLGCSLVVGKRGHWKKDLGIIDPLAVSKLSPRFGLELKVHRLAHRLQVSGRWK